MRTRPPTISVIIVTKNRQTHLDRCLKSISINSIQPNEIIIINEGTAISASDLPQSQKNITKIINLSASNLSHGRNIGITHAISDIICFTDDDCIVSKNWLEMTVQALTDHTCIGVFGQVKPYHLSQNRNRYSTCLVNRTQPSIVTTPCYHAKYIGLGNNMAFQKRAFCQYGLFKQWLGIGSVGKSAEDAEFSLRLLLKKERLLYDPQVIVHHDKWLTENQFLSQNLLYTCGEMACYGYYSFSGYKFAQNIVHNNWVDFYYDIKRMVEDTIKRKIINTADWKYSALQLHARIWGLSVGLFYFIKEVI